ncbi:MAG TPA: nicotinate-nicotinamide nucleotide adenylyltransferase [Polyangiaceae bacterium]
MKVGFFGGSFDPPHVAHVLAVSYVLSVARFDRVLVVPVFDHALKVSHAPFAERLQMCRIALGWLPGALVSDIEHELGHPSFTLRTLETLRARNPDWSLRLVIGSDVLFETHKWHAFAEVSELAPPFVLGRVGAEHALGRAGILPDISSSRVRELLARRDDPEVAPELAAVVPSGVLDFIDARGLYR